MAIFSYCRDNFLKIQLFYGDISYNSLKQSPAYDVETLLGMLLRTLWSLLWPICVANADIIFLPCGFFFSLLT